MPQYRPAGGQGEGPRRPGGSLYLGGTEAKTNDDHYILSTVFFAAVLFFAGISLRLAWRPLRIFVLGMGGAAARVGYVRRCRSPARPG